MAGDLHRKDSENAKVFQMGSELFCSAVIRNRNESGAASSLRSLPFREDDGGLRKAVAAFVPHFATALQMRSYFFGRFSVITTATFSAR